MSYKNYYGGTLFTLNERNLYGKLCRRKTHRVSQGSSQFEGHSHGCFQAKEPLYMGFL